MQVQNNVISNSPSFKGITRTIVPASEFMKAGVDVAKDVLVPYAKKMSSNYDIFVGGPRFPEVISKITKVDDGKVMDSFKKAGATNVPEYFSDVAPQTTFIVTGQKDIERVRQFNKEQQSWWDKVKEAGSDVATEKGFSDKIADAYGEYCAYIAVQHRFLKQFGADIKDKTFESIKSAINKK